MAEMSAEQRQAAMFAFMEGVDTELGAVVKPDLQAAVDALDTWVNANAANANNALPEPAKSELTTPQKALLLNVVNSHRYLGGV